MEPMLGLTLEKPKENKGFGPWRPMGNPWGPMGAPWGTPGFRAVRSHWDYSRAPFWVYFFFSGVSALGPRGPGPGALRCGAALQRSLHWSQLGKESG